ncbi:MAG: penicillin-binding protein 2 [Kineosporiaceae bacterium]
MNAPVRRLSAVVALLFALLLGSTTWIQVIDAKSLDERPGNARTLYKEYSRQRGPIVVAGDAVAESVPSDDVYTYQRRYPGGQLYAPVTGAYSVVYGTSGLERASNGLLAGTADELFSHRLSDLLTGRRPSGAAVELTLDPRAQKVAWDALGDQRGAVVALEPATGKVLALVSKPSYDPNLLAGHDTAKVRTQREALLARDDRPMDNRAIASRGYPPGSVFKLVTSAAALSSGRWTPDSVIPSPDSLDLPQTTKNLVNFEGESCGGSQVSLTKALEVSCNTAFGWLGLQLGDDALREQAEKFGFDADLDIPLPVTRSTYPADPDLPGTAQTAIGQFDVRVTPMQMAMVASAIANGGSLMHPTLVNRVLGGEDLGVIDKPEPKELSRAVTASVAADLTRMMVDVVEKGTGRRARIDGVTVAGKTGTAQQGEGRPPNAWFVAFAPAENPEVAVAVVVEDGGALGDAASGGKVAAPIARAVMEAVVKR